MFQFSLIVFQDFRSFKHNTLQMKDDNLICLTMQIMKHLILNTELKCKRKYFIHKKQNNRYIQK